MTHPPSGSTFKTGYDQDNEDGDVDVEDDDDGDDDNHDDDDDLPRRSHRRMSQWQTPRGTSSLRSSEFF